MTNPVDPPAAVAPLLRRLGRSSTRMRVSMVITAVLCLLIAAGIGSDPSLGRGWGRAAGVAGTIFFLAVTGLLIYGAFWRQHRHIGRLRRILDSQPQRIRSIRLMVARAVPNASWAPDDGSARTGLHVFVTDDTGATWLLPVSRAEATGFVAALAQRCPQASVEPGSPGD
ncbi:MAG: hypothetical protein U0R66_15505 [Mycobacterium sp.]